MTSSREGDLYRNGNDVVTGTRATLGGQTIDLADINTVSLIPPILRPEYGYGLAALGLVIGVVGYLVWGVFLTPVLAGVVLVIVGLALAFAVKTSYTVRLNRTNGQTTMVNFSDRSRAEQVVAALSRALSNKR